MFIVLLSNIVNGSNHTKCVPLSNQKCMTQPTLTNLHPHEYSQEFHYYPVTVNLDRCVRRCNTLNDLSNKVCIPNKTEDLNLSMFNMITGINVSKTLAKHISCKCKCRCECKKRHVCEKYYVSNPATCTCENGIYLASIMDDSAITCNEIIESYDEDAEAKSYDETNFNENKATYEIQLLPFHYTNNELREVLY